MASTASSVNVNSDTWRQVSEWANEQRQQAVNRLIAGSPQDERLRGRIEQIDELLALGEEAAPLIPMPDY